MKLDRKQLAYRFGQAVGLVRVFGVPALLLVAVVATVVWWWL